MLKKKLKDFINRIIYGDNLEIMKQIPDDSIDLIYIDPPFGIKIDKKFGMIKWKNYKPKIHYIEKFNFPINESEQNYLNFMYIRLKEMNRLLKESGSIYVHIDWHMGHYVKILLDDIFAKENLVNEIIWCYTQGVAPLTVIRINMIRFFGILSQKNLF